MIESGEMMEFMTKEEMQIAAPAVFTTTPSSEVSKHYTHIPTSRVIDDMELLGWGVVDVKEVKARKASTRGVQKHLVCFRNPEVVIKGDDGDEVFPQIVLTNSHDGKNAFTFVAGLFRLVCANGLVIATEKFEDVKMRHMGYTFEDLQVNIREMVARLPLTVDSMNAMKRVILNEQAVLDFAKEALECRFDKKQVARIEVDLKDLISPTRREDVGNDVWTVFNVVQEKLIQGDFDYISGTKVRKARKVKNFKQDQKINRELFSLALEYAS